MLKEKIFFLGQGWNCLTDRVDTPVKVPTKVSAQNEQ